jgi:serine/threonine-protein kinase RsbW
MVEWVLPDDLTAAGAAREHVADALAALALPAHVRDDLVLITSELAANAVRHGSPPALLRLEHDKDRVRVTVGNHGDAPDPRILTADPDADHGRGLAMVEQMADTVGWSRDGDRLDVWAEVRLRG